jgi:hypothetical protein
MKGSETELTAQVMDIKKTFINGKSLKALFFEKIETAYKTEIAEKGNKKRKSIKE